jgi:hypothetical protein
MAGNVGSFLPQAEAAEGKKTNRRDLDPSQTRLACGPTMHSSSSQASRITTTSTATPRAKDPRTSQSTVCCSRYNLPAVCITAKEAFHQCLPPVILSLMPTTVVNMGIRATGDATQIDRRRYSRHAPQCVRHHTLMACV